LGTALLAGLACRGAEEEISAVDRAFEQAMESYEVAETPQVKVALIRDFLSDYPESEYTADALNAAVEPLVDELERPEEAYELFDEVLGRIEDPGIKLEAQMQLAQLHVETERLEELDSLIDAMTSEHELRFTDHYQLAGIALEASAWALAIEQAEASLVFASPEAYKAQYQDRVTDEQAQRNGRRRIALALAVWEITTRPREVFRPRYPTPPIRCSASTRRSCTCTGGRRF
jgi:hypothetical protein